MSQVLDIVCSFSCLFYCLLHSFINMFSLKKLSKRVELVCDKCGSVSTSQFDYPLTDDQIKALYEFVKSLKEVCGSGTK